MRENTAVVAKEYRARLFLEAYVSVFYRVHDLGVAIFHSVREKNISNAVRITAEMCSLLLLVEIVLTLFLKDKKLRRTLIKRTKRLRRV